MVNEIEDLGGNCQTSCRTRGFPRPRCRIGKTSNANLLINKSFGRLRAPNSDAVYHVLCSGLAVLIRAHDVQGLETQLHKPIVPPLQTSLELND